MSEKSVKFIKVGKTLNKKRKPQDPPGKEPGVFIALGETYGDNPKYKYDVYVSVVDGEGNVVVENVKNPSITVRPPYVSEKMSEESAAKLRATVRSELSLIVES